MAALGAQLLGDAAGQQPAERLPLFLALDDRPVQKTQPLERALVPAPDRPDVVATRCIGCLACVEICPRDALQEVRS
jgi:ferredoxin